MGCRNGLPVKETFLQTLADNYSKVRRQASCPETSPLLVILKKRLMYVAMPDRDNDQSCMPRPSTSCAC